MLQQLVMTVQDSLQNPQDLPGHPRTSSWAYPDIPGCLPYQRSRGLTFPGHPEALLGWPGAFYWQVARTYPRRPYSI